ncbi:protein NUCLEAR FUSION DEFECTIVE 4 [Magnolia sinica]|uniref:protein NUCLEAR FUSION DEFECTIVE 4 n=1 Tax=Magnolia sinica TaxID=86752 RepID=UPI00265B3546|nr:protein NUCLEAR FUSION DEFECTIVE 4 [Magnolia sinica]
MPSPSSLQWLSLVAIIWLQSINGTNSDFPAYSSEIKRLLSISQVQLNNLAFASDAGKLLGWVSGIAAAHLPLWLVLLIGAVLGLIGYGVQYLFLVKTITSLPYWQTFLLCVLAGNSICWINTVSYVATIQNFPSDSQIAVGLSTSYFGLSAKIYTSMVDLIFHGPSIKKAEGYLLLNAVVPVAASVVTAPLVREIKNEKGTKLRGGFVAMFFITIATGVYALISTVGPLSRRLSSVAHAVGLGVLLVVPVVIPAMAMIRDGFEARWASKRERRVYSFSMDEISGDVLEIDVKGGDGVGEDGVMGVGEEIGVKKMVRRVEFWLYFFVYMFGATLGLVFLNNLGQIAESRGLSKTSSLVSLSSSFGFFGRLIPSLLDYLVSKNRYMVSRTASIATYMAPMAGAFFLLLSTTNLSLYISTAIIGVCTGAITSVAVSTTSELFGAKNFSINHNIIVANIPIGSLLFGYSAALLYQKEGNAGNGKCMGFECYKTTFLVWGFISSLGTLLSFILYIRTRKFYLQRS